MTNLFQNKLLLLVEGAVASQHVLQEGTTYLGRGPDSDVFLKDSMVSRRHGRITSLSGQCIYEDLSSDNGTFIEGEPVKKHYLTNGDRLSIGPYELEYREVGKASSHSVSSEQTIYGFESTTAWKTGRHHQNGQIGQRALPGQGDRSSDGALTDLLRTVFPLLAGLKGYGKAHLLGDLNAGFTVAAMLIPQGMASAMLAGLPPVTGLYASMLPLLLYALVGTSRHMSVGPGILDSILVAVGVGVLAQVGTQSYITLVIMLAACIGGIQLLMGITRLGFLVNFLSYPVLTGFNAAVAVITALSQLQHVAGIDAPMGYQLDQMIENLSGKMMDINPYTLALGIAAILGLVGLKRWLPRLPGPLIVAACCTAVVWLLCLDNEGISIVGSIPAGLPELVVPVIDWQVLATLLPLAFTLALVGFAQSIAIAKTFAHKGNYHVDANQELIGLGLANLGASASQAVPVSGGLSRSAVNARAGAHTQLAGVFAVILIALALVYIADIVYFLPNAALAAIILVAVIGLIDFEEMNYLFRVKKSEGLLLLVTLIATLVFGIVIGLALGIVASMLLFITLNTRPHSAILGRLAGTDVFRNTRDFPEAESIEGLIILRIDASLYFANTEFLKSKLRNIREQYQNELKAIVLDASAVNDLDSSADTALHQIVTDYHRHGIEFYIAGVKGPVRRIMKRSGLYELLGADHFFFTIDAAVKRHQQKR